jgi:adenine-specific DNA-methyltransferase
MSTTYVPRQHAYQRTEEFLFSQLIPYIGSKRRLIGLIDRAVSKTGVTGGVFGDLFAGSGVVSRYAKARGFRVIANDWEPYSYVLNSAIISLNTPPGDETLLRELNNLPGLEGYITTNYCPADDYLADPTLERMYYTRSNGMKIDAIRTAIAKWHESGRIDDRQMHYLLAPLICAASFTSNTSGVFKAYHNGWGGKTGTAHYRILSELVLKPVQLYDNEMDNLTLAMDAAELARSWSSNVGASPDIVYLDPPYNQHPYGSNYHMLNSIALWDCLEVPNITEAKCAIRTDWRTERRSHFNHAAMALPALEDLLDNLDCRWVLMSYSTDGNIDLQALINAFASRGTLAVVANAYKRYRVSSQRMSKQSHNVEFVLILDRNGVVGSGRDTVNAEINDFHKSELPELELSFE